MMAPATTGGEDAAEAIGENDVDIASGTDANGSGAGISGVKFIACEDVDDEDAIAPTSMMGPVAPRGGGGGGGAPPTTTTKQHNAIIMRVGRNTYST